MGVPGILSNLSTRKNILKLLLLVALFQIVFNYFLPTNIDTSLTQSTFDENVEDLKNIGHSPIITDDHKAAQKETSKALVSTTGGDKTSAASNSLNDKKLSVGADITTGETIKDFLAEETVTKGKEGSLDTSFFKTAMEIFVKNKPQGIEDLTLKEKAPSYFYIDLPNPTFTIDFLSGFLQMSKEQETELKSKHNQLKDDILNLDFPKNTFKGKGIVMIGGGSFLGTALTSIRALRETGSKLPLQLMLTDQSEYDEDVCNMLLPKLNAECLIMEKIVGAELFKTLNLQKYELKVLGLFLSTFEEVLLLDADNLAVKSPDYILESKPYKEFGYIIWPDFWRQTISPSFYNIAGVEIGEPVRKDGVPPEDPNPPRAESQLSDLEGAIPDSTCEAGQLAINKRLHHRSLMATVYYNLYGFKYYYWILGQGAVGIGDKDTFIAGLTVFKEPFYFVKQRPLLWGYDHDGGWQDTTMVQFDPEQDYDYYKKAKDYLIAHGIDSRVNLFLNWEYTNSLRDKIHEANNMSKPDVQFLHIHSPKFNALKNLKANDYEVNGRERRQFGSREKIKDQIPLDWELKISRISQWLACESEIIPNDWKETPRDEICNRIKKHVDWLIETSDTPEMAQLKDLGV